MATPGPSGGQSSIQAIVGALGFAVVDVNMRGTGCSGGSFDFFEPPQSLDGYDVIETIARQPWVLHNKVGMMGVSYGGISQLFVAATRPPSLSAIAPLSVIDQTQTTLYPGGILNTGFALNWAEERVDDAEAASPDSGQAWAYEQIQNGDQICKDNQQLHPQAVDLLAKVRRNSSYKPKVADPLAPLTFVDKIKVPTFMACQWTDEQTGGHCPTLASRFTGTDKKWFTFTNGTHVDSLAPETFNKLVRLPLALRRAAKTEPRPGSDRRRAGRLPGRDGHQRRHPAAGPDPDAARLRLGAGRLRGPAAGPDPVRQRGGRPARLPVSRVRAVVQQVPRSGDEGEARSSSTAAARCARSPRRTALPTRSSGTRRRGRRQTSRGDTGSGTDGLWTESPPYNWTQNPAGTAASYVTAPLNVEHHGPRRAARCRPGCAPRRPTSTCR